MGSFLSIIPTQKKDMENTKWNDLFISCILKEWKDIDREERETLRERKISLNKNFLFNDENVQKLRHLNDILHKREASIQAHANRLREVQKEWLGNKWIDDIEMEYTLGLWNSRLDVLHPEFEGNPFYKGTLNHFRFNDEEHDDAFINDNWNEAFGGTHTMANDFHCYTFHHLYDHTYLSWEDIIGIEQVWIEIVVQNQFLIDTAKHKTK